MTKQNFIALADTVRGLRPPFDPVDHAQWITFNDMLDALCAFCRAQNPRFDEATFRGYIAGTCGPSGGRARGK